MVKIRGGGGWYLGVLLFLNNMIYSRGHKGPTISSSPAPSHDNWYAVPYLLSFSFPFMHTYSHFNLPRVKILWQRSHHTSQDKSLIIPQALNPPFLLPLQYDNTCPMDNVGLARVLLPHSQDQIYKFFYVVDPIHENKTDVSHMRTIHFPPMCLDYAWKMLFVSMALVFFSSGFY